MRLARARDARCRRSGRNGLHKPGLGEGYSSASAMKWSSTATSTSESVSLRPGCRSLGAITLEGGFGNKGNIYDDSGSNTFDLIESED